MQAWSSFPVRPTNSVPKQTDMTKENTLSQSLNNRLSDDPVFFVYDHNMLKKEEDDLKDAILYFSPEYMPADDQCALCGQLMGMAEFLSASISQSAPSFFKFDHEKFALKRIGSYSLGLQASVSIPDSVISEQLMNLYKIFVTFHGSVDSVRLRFKDSHSHFLKEFSTIWRVILEVSKVSLHSTLSQTFNNVPCVHLPKSGSHLFLQASHLLQASQRRPFVLAGAIFYKNKVLCTQLSPTLTRHLTFLQNQIPYIAKNTESDMPKGCKTITMFLTDDELRGITPQHSNTNRHCKITNFHQPIEHSLDNPEHKSRKKLTRRLTCSSVPEFSSEKLSQSPSNVPEQNLKRYMKNNHVKSYNSKQNAFGIEKSTWGKNSFKSKMRLSHVPLVECRGGESPLIDDVNKLLNSSVDNKTYQQLELSQHLDSFALNASRDASVTYKQKTENSDMDEKHTVLKHVDVTKNTVIGNVRDNSNSANKDSEKSLSYSVHSNNVSANRGIENNKSVDTKNCGLHQNDSSKDIQTVGKSINFDDATKANHVLVNGDKGKDGNTHEYDNEFVGIVNTKTEVFDDRSEQGITEIVAIENPSVSDVSVQHNNQLIRSKEKDLINQDDKKSVPHSEYDINNIRSKLNETDSGCFEVSLKESHTSLSPLKQDGKIVASVSPRVLTESDIETEDEGDIVQESFVPCIACLDMNSDNPVESCSLKSKCEKCEGQLIVKQVINKSGTKQEIIDFGSKTDGVNSDTDAEAQSDIEGRHFYTAKTEAFTDKAGLSSFSSDVSTDSSISRYWTYEMEGLNDVTVYVQCHSEISLLLIMENPEQFEENLFHSLWKGSLNHLADLDYYITESLENEESTVNDVNYKFARFDAFSSELDTNIDDAATKRRDMYQQQMLSVLHSNFKDRHCLTDVTLRSHLACCYGHHREGEETYFQPELSNRAVSGLPMPKDPAFNLDSVAKKRLAEDKKITVL